MLPYVRGWPGVCRAGKPPPQETNGMPRPVTLSLDLLQTFLLLVEHEGDASVTAQQLGINQPSMSKRLSFLQHSGRVLVKPWLVREGKTWKLTVEGQKVLPA